MSCKWLVKLVMWHIRASCCLIQQVKINTEKFYFDLLIGTCVYCLLLPTFSVRWCFTVLSLKDDPWNVIILCSGVVMITWTLNGGNTWDMTGFQPWRIHYILTTVKPLKLNNNKFTYSWFLEKSCGWLMQFKSIAEIYYRRFLQYCCTALSSHLSLYLYYSSIEVSHFQRFHCMWYKMYAQTWKFILQ